MSLDQRPSAVLGIDASGETYSVGLWSQRFNLEVSGFQSRTALRNLPGSLTYLLTTANIQATDLTAIGVVAGPGSFTGVRLGVTVAKTAALVANCPIRAWDTLEILAHQALPQGSLGTVAVALDARRGEVYSAIFQRSLTDTTALTPLLPTGVRSPESFQQNLAQLPSLHAAIGPGFASYPNLLPTCWNGVRTAQKELSAPRGQLIAELTAKNSDRLLPAELIEPTYHRRADIQVVAPPCSPT